jgi:hypothetical protein
MAKAFKIQLIQSVSVRLSSRRSLKQTAKNIAGKQVAVYFLEPFSRTLMLYHD